MASRAPFTNEQILKAAEILLIATGKYKTKCGDWLSHDRADRTQENLKAEFSEEYALQNELNMTTAQAGYHATNAVTDTTNVSDIAPELNQAVTHFKEASADTFQQLTTTNEDLQQQLAYLQTHMMNMVNNNTKMMPMEQQPAYQLPQYMQQNMIPPLHPTY